MSRDEHHRAPKLSELWIDIGAANREEAEKFVPLGSVATRATQLERLHGDLVVSRALDNKAGIFTLVETMHSLSAQRKALRAGVFFVSAVQEEVGSRGVLTSTY